MKFIRSLVGIVSGMDIFTFVENTRGKEHLMSMKIEIQGRDAVEATKELLAIDGLQGSYQTLDEVEREGTLATIATIVGIVSGTITIGEKLYQWNQKYQKSLPDSAGPRIEKVLIVDDNNRRLLLKNATVEQIQEFLKGQNK